MNNDHLISEKDLSSITTSRDNGNAIDLDGSRGIDDVLPRVATNDESLPMLCRHNAAKDVAEYLFILPFKWDTGEGGREYFGSIGDGVKRDSEQARRLFRATLYYLGCMPDRRNQGEVGAFTVEEYQRRIREALGVAPEMCRQDYPEQTIITKLGPTTL